MIDMLLLLELFFSKTHSMTHLRLPQKSIFITQTVMLKCCVFLSLGFEMLSTLNKMPDSFAGQWKVIASGNVCVRVSVCVCVCVWFR